MFSFHKPKIYRSLNGCCICRAKSSSSRFTDSKRYEQDFERCFHIAEKRSGEICNACVLLVKRWKKLPVGSNRNWNHVVDARAGPGTKSMNKIRKSREESILTRKHKHKKFLRSRRNSQGDLSDDGVDDLSEHSNDTQSPMYSDASEDEGIEETRKSSNKGRRKKSQPHKMSTFLDLNYWKKTKICCGVVFLGPNGACLVDPRLFHPCRSKTHTKTETEAFSINEWQDENSCSSDMCPAYKPESEDHIVDKCSQTEEHHDRYLTPDPSDPSCVLNDPESLYDSASNHSDSLERLPSNNTKHINNANFVSQMDIDEDQVLDLSLPQRSSSLVPRPICVQTEA